jgi:hypothetical protein
VSSESRARLERVQLLNPVFQEVQVPGTYGAFPMVQHVRIINFGSSVITMLIKSLFLDLAYTGK